MAKPTYRTKKQPGRNRILLIALGSLVGIAFIALLVYAAIAASRPEPNLGEEIPIVSAEHIPNGQKANDYNSDPPTSGQHYADPAEAGFYEEAPPDEQLVHNLEHGYVVVYYNCSNLGENECETLKDGIRQSMEAAGVTDNTRTLKIIAAPRPTMENLVTYTSWGRLYRVNSLDRDEFLTFVRKNRNQAPEPFAP